MIVKTDEKNYQDIADAIRSKLGIDQQFKPSEMASAIEGIPNPPQLSQLGWDAEDIARFEQDLDVNIKYSKELLDSWNPNNPNNTSMQNKYSGNKKMIIAPKFDTSKVTKFTQMFSNNTGLMSIPLYDTSKAREMFQMFYLCSALTSIPHLNTSAVINMDTMFCGCYNLVSIPPIDTSNVTSSGQMFLQCHSLREIPPLNTSKFNSFYRMFESCYALTTIPLLDVGNVTTFYNAFLNCTKLENLGGFKNLKLGIDLSYSPLITHDSLMNVINNLYDLASNGLSAQTLTLGADNLAKLTDDEKAIASNKGWTLA